MADQLQQSLRDVEPAHCPDCRTEMLRYRSIPMNDTAPQTVAHFFQCPNCNRLEEKTDERGNHRSGERSAPAFATPNPSLVSDAAMNERMDKARMYRTFAERCMELIEQLPQDTHRELTEMAEVWLELAHSELKPEPAANLPASTDGSPHGSISSV